MEHASSDTKKEPALQGSFEKDFIGREVAVKDLQVRRWLGLLQSLSRLKGGEAEIDSVNRKQRAKCNRGVCEINIPL